MHIESTESLNPVTPGEILEAMIARLMIEIVRGASLVNQRSLALTCLDGRQSFRACRNHIDYETAVYVSRLRALAAAHGLDPLNRMSVTDLELVRLATAPLNREEATS